MKIAVVYHPSLPARPLDPATLWTSTRGLTGSELSSLMYAQYLADRGHDVSWYGSVQEPTSGMLGRAQMRPYTDAAMSDGHDAVIAWNTDAALRTGTGSALRILNMQVSDFGWCQPGWEAHVDLFCPLSMSHAQHMRSQTHLSSSQWRIMPNGVDLDAFKSGGQSGDVPKVPGRVLWASSHDRGLHHLLACWPSVRRALPHAELNVLYDTSGLNAHAANAGATDPLMAELAKRATWCLAALERLEWHGVRLIGSVSRERIAREMAQAEVLAYPCDTVRYSETFGVSVLEAMASGCVPVITNADAFGELWCPAAPHVSLPISPSAYTDMLVGVLSDASVRADYASRGRRHAGLFSWPVLAERLEKCIASRGAEGLVKAWQ